MPQGTVTFRVDGLQDLLRVVDAEPQKVKREIRKALRKIAEPVRDEATRRALTDIGTRHHPKPSAIKYGISVRKVGTISVESRLARSGDEKRRRKSFSRAQRTKALDPAAEANEANTLKEFQGVLDDLERRWGRAGV